MALLKKKNVPDELPELITDKIEKIIDLTSPNLKEINKKNLESEKRDNENNSSNEQKEEKKVLVLEEKENKKEEKEIKDKNEEKKEDKETLSKEKEDSSLKKNEEINLETKSFFSDLEKVLTKEIKDIDELEKWYENKFFQRDIVSEMRNYWEKQKDTNLLKLMGKNFKERILQIISDLQKLEKEWQNIYFELIEKEEKIKEKEIELKKALSELLEICKQNKKDYPRLEDNKDKILNLSL